MQEKTKVSDKFNKLKENQNKFLLWASFFLSYPDYFIDMITPKDSFVELYAFQRIMLRVFFRYQYVFGTFTRGSSKSFMSELANILVLIMKPRIKTLVTASGSREQAKKIADEKIGEAKSLFPTLLKEIENLNTGKDYLDLDMVNGSKSNVVGCNGSARGGRKFCVLTPLIAGSTLESH